MKKVDHFLFTQKREYNGMRESFDVVQMNTENKNRAENEPTKGKIKPTKDWNWNINGYSWIEETKCYELKKSKKQPFRCSMMLRALDTCCAFYNFIWNSFYASGAAFASFHSVLNEWDAPATISILYSFCFYSHWRNIISFKRGSPSNEQPKRLIDEMINGI